MAKYVSIGQLQGEIKKSFASLKKYMDENIRAPVVSIAQQAKALADELIRRADSGEFKGDTGPRGEPGAPGVPGETGPQGPQGEPGGIAEPVLDTDGVLQFEEGGSGGLFLFHFTIISGAAYLADGTMQDIHDAYTAGKVVIGVCGDEFYSFTGEYGYETAYWRQSLVHMYTGEVYELAADILYLESRLDPEDGWLFHWEPMKNPIYYFHCTTYSDGTVHLNDASMNTIHAALAEGRVVMGTNGNETFVFQQETGYGGSDWRIRLSALAAGADYAYVAGMELRQGIPGADGTWQDHAIV